MSFTKEEVEEMQRRVEANRKIPMFVDNFADCNSVISRAKANRAPRKRKKQSHPESELQRECVAWFRVYYSNHLIFAVPNAAKRGLVLAAIMKAEGVTAGVPDLFVAALGVHNGKVAPGLFIEMKHGKGKSTPMQKHIQSRLATAGYVVTECRTFPEFQSIVDRYFHP